MIIGARPRFASLCSTKKPLLIAKVFRCVVPPGTQDIPMIIGARPRFASLCSTKKPLLIAKVFHCVVPLGAPFDPDDYRDSG